MRRDGTAVGSEMTDIGKAEALAAKIERKANDTLAALDREMDIMKWPPEFRAIMWGAVAHAAALREGESKEVHTETR